MATGSARARRTQPEDVTLLELVTALGELVDSPEEVAAHARQLIASGAVRLRGNFRDAPWAILGEPSPGH